MSRPPWSRTATSGTSTRPAAWPSSCRRCPTTRPTTTRATVLSRLDGLILAGGVDVEPGRYGQRAARVGAAAASGPRRLRAPAGQRHRRRRLPGARHLSRHAGDGGGRRRHPRAAPPRPARPPRALAGARDVRRAPGRARARQPAGRHPRRPGHGRDLPPPGRRSRRPATPRPAGRTTASWRRSRTRVRGSGSRCSGTRRSASTRGCSRPWSRPAGPATETSYDV